MTKTIKRLFQKIFAGKLGFTLIELLVVIAVIGLISSIILASLNSARSKSRDARRIADLKQIKLALEIFYDSYGRYPLTNGAATWDGHWQFFSTCLETGGGCGLPTPGFSPALSKVPQDPLDDPATLSDADPTYYYYPWYNGIPDDCRDGEKYRVAALLENANSALDSDLDGAVTYCADALRGYCVGEGTCSWF